ncbi:pectinesterase inhibitor 10-like [Magnolia sinica]|uniref:pectinesterase inhibitor 10-like n=1 Tax=Magnolia sinica TaxID=86752 RepID=UPI00265A6D33|nr:pectinesterase inhibitor 10-like [Magnolia sinica]
MFVGYSLTQKGYKFVNPDTGRRYVTHDASFFEYLNFFSPKSSILFSSSHVTPIPFLDPPSSTPLQVAPSSPSYPPSSIILSSPPPFFPPPPPRHSTRPNTRPTHLQDYICSQALLPAPPHVSHHQQKRSSSDSPLLPSPSSAALRSIFASDLPTSLWKGTHPSTSHPIHHFVSYYSISPSYKSFIANVDSIFLPTRVDVTLAHPKLEACHDG